MLRLLRWILVVWLLYFTVGAVLGLSITWWRMRTLKREIARLDRLRIYYQSKLDRLQDPRYLDVLGLQYGYLHPQRVFSQEQE